MEIPYHSVRAASLGPGNLATGLKYRRYMAPAIRYTTKAEPVAERYGYGTDSGKPIARCVAPASSPKGLRYTALYNAEG
jgi:hypothetical protein